MLSFAYIRQLVAEVVPALRGGGPRRNGGLAAAVVLRPLVAALAAGRVPEHRRVPLFCVLVDALSTGVGDNSGDGTFSDVPVNQFTRGTSLHCSTEISLRFAGGSAVAAGYRALWHVVAMVLASSHGNPYGHRSSGRSVDLVDMCHALCHRFSVVAQLACLRRLLRAAHQLAPTDGTPIAGSGSDGDGQANITKNSDVEETWNDNDKDLDSDTEGDDAGVIACCNEATPARPKAASAASRRDVALATVQFVADHLASPLFITRLFDLRQTDFGDGNISSNNNSCTFSDGNTDVKCDRESGEERVVSKVRAQRGHLLLFQVVLAQARRFDAHCAHARARSDSRATSFWVEAVATLGTVLTRVATLMGVPGFVAATRAMLQHGSGHYGSALQRRALQLVADKVEQARYRTGRFHLTPFFFILDLRGVAL